MSLDGYIAGPAETGFEHLFKWYGNGDVEVPTANPEMTLHVRHERGPLPRDRRHGRRARRRSASLRFTDAWGGRHPMDRPVVVVTHSVPEGWPREEAPFTFVSEGIESAIEQARAIAGDKAGRLISFQRR